ncbi:MAG: GNAT family N-acetyltransferase [Ignavibacteria bacterium]|nr:GNAT family N-acetyltransferase [Ignavibacteria bacterium]
MIHITHKHFSELTTNECYDVLSFRENIFVVEQNCPYLDADGFDKQAFHVIVYDDTTIIAYCRILAPNMVYSEPAIGRVAVHKEYRGLSIGKELMKYAITLLYHLYGTIPIHISAQEYLRKFYTELGFTAVSEIYLEDGIPHIGMIKYE